MSNAPNLRRPRFLGPEPRRAEPAPARFDSLRPEQPPEVPSPLAPVVPEPARVAPPQQVPVAPPPPAPNLAETHEALLGRVQAAAELFQAEAARLAEQVRADAVEIAFQVARKLLDAELESNPELAFNAVRAAVRKLGETHRLTVRMNPRDLERVRARIDPARELTVAELELIPDPELQRGDCVVEGANGRVDGRLGSRLEELRNAVQRAAREEDAA